MKEGVIAVMALLAGSVVTFAGNQNSWATVPELRLLRKMVESTMVEYSHWAAEFRQSGRAPSPADWTVNSMTEEIFIQLLTEMNDDPDPVLLRRCLLFLGEDVPPQFDRIWRMVFLELSSNIDREIGQEVDAILTERGLTPLIERSMAKRELLKYPTPPESDVFARGLPTDQAGEQF